MCLVLVRVVFLPFLRRAATWAGLAQMEVCGFPQEQFVSFSQISNSGSPTHTGPVEDSLQMREIQG